jgi:diguanylate cyclase (GGDEF)-like protein
MAWLAASLNEASARREFLLERRLQVEANTDLLTGILNRRALQQVAEEEIARSLRYGQPLSLLLLDLDRFKSLNDRFGHDMGDRALQLSASSFRDSLRSSDRVARWGGEEFLVLLPSTGLAEASLLAQRLRRNIEELTLPSGVEPVRWTVSVGVAQLEPGQGWIELLARADKALYRAKEEGRNRVVAAEASAGAEASARVQEGGKA